jgi:tripeptidyl-peptidase-1
MPDRYNNGSARGYPDLSANGADFVTAVDGRLFLSYGTSSAIPVVAAAFAFINKARAKVGKAPVGL